MDRLRDKAKSRMKFKDWIVLLKFGKFEKEFKMEDLKKPFKVGKVEVPDDLSGITMGQLIKLQNLNEGNMFEVMANEILGINGEDLMECDAVEVVEFAGWVMREIQKINELFEKVNVKPTKEEIKAGIERLKFGVFGLVDWYAQRMGITDHEDVMSVPWMRVYKCLQMDTESNLYKDRLRRIYNERRK